MVFEGRSGRVFRVRLRLLESYADWIFFRRGAGTGLLAGTGAGFDAGMLIRGGVGAFGFSVTFLGALVASAREGARVSLGMSGRSAGASLRGLVVGVLGVPRGE